VARLVHPLVVIAVASAAAPAAAHVQPSVDANNRYYKITPMGDRVRVAYTVLFGEKPGAVMRRRLDRDRDGAISTAEADVVGRELAAALAGSVTMAVDGAPVAWTWARVDVGLGTPVVAGGSFAIDLIAFVCVAGGDGEHRFALRDEHALDAPGDSEVKLEDGPGVTLGASTLGGEPMVGPDAAWTGRGGPIATGLEVRYRIDAQAPRPLDGRCGDTRAARAQPTRWPWFAGGGALIGLVVALTRRRRDAGS
jgi:hypothetical protein